ncbi:50S ribosomal protein L18 [Candidatus Woesebacteria bacterium RIFCSPLOWO2_01_FULL_39_21]|uniref:Large ribosomal subunit protein uL18 n=1 Tax=Candidatus Woesebacteria bacterium RIFCSPLOWO2_01_FULL_39_21 TaxID=1802519 RepID=A0A1F8BDF8_9BACT|nr:MAG: 50S ribosomal protein L18 [Candidatus Woesebacteria bacterium RIFCSPHIGHO2_01_FULL_39_23]OGM62033.1 MAG: 50S ribosomal protein L18 [Candidatus Woesebacteria bacterium RIFCSPLOWO2_01_FULL_39_21]
MQKKDMRLRRKRRIRSKISGTKEVPRISVFRSIKHIYAQIINDVKGTTLVSFSDKKLKDGGGKSKIEVASYVGEKLAELAKSKKITKAVFDKGSYKFHGRVKALADGLRRGGLKF